MNRVTGQLIECRLCDRLMNKDEVDQACLEIAHFDK